MFVSGKIWFIFSNSIIVCVFVSYTFTERGRGGFFTWKRTTSRLFLLPAVCCPVFETHAHLELVYCTHKINWTERERIFFFSSFHKQKTPCSSLSPSLEKFYNMFSFDYTLFLFNVCRWSISSLVNKLVITS